MYVSEFVARHAERSLQPWEYCEVRIALDYALAKYSKEEIMKALNIETKMLKRWIQKNSYPTRIKFNQLKNIDDLVKKNS